MLNYIPGGADSAAGGNSSFRAAGLTIDRFGRFLLLGAPFDVLISAEKTKN